MRHAFLAVALWLLAALSARAQFQRTVGRFQEVFAWKQITFNIDGNLVLADRSAAAEEGSRRRRQADTVFFDNHDNAPDREWDQRLTSSTPRGDRGWQSQWGGGNGWPTTTTRRPSTTARRPSTTTTESSSDDSSRFFIQYNNLPMGVERVGDRLFVTLPRRRYGVPSTLNYLDLRQDSGTRSPGLRPYPNLRASRELTSVYRTRADECGRLWMVDTGLLEIPNNPQQVQPPAIVVYDLRTDRQILRYPFKSSDIPAANTPTGLASITIDITRGDCGGAYAYVPDLATYGLIVYSLRDNDSWRLSHNYFHFHPSAGNLNLAGLRFQWNDGIFSLTLTSPGADGCRAAYFHPMVGTQEYSVTNCVLKNRTASADANYWALYSEVGDRGANGQCAMHDYHPGTQVVFFANIGRDAVACWNTGTVLSPGNVALLAQDSQKMSYPSDLHVSSDEVWVMANSLPTWAYSRLDTEQYNFYIYKANVQNLIAGTVCAGRGSSYAAGRDAEQSSNE